MQNDMDYETFVRDQIIRALIGPHGEDRHLREACKLYGVNLEEFKKKYSGEIMFALLKR